MNAVGPCREFFRLLLQEIMTNNSLFEGSSDSRVPAHNMVALEQHKFKFIGQMIAVSIVHGGPGPQCLSHAVVDYITYGMSSTHAGVSDIPNFEVREKLKLVSLECILCIHGCIIFLISLVARKRRGNRLSEIIR